MSMSPLRIIFPPLAIWLLLIGCTGSDNTDPERVPASEGISSAQATPVESEGDSLTEGEPDPPEPRAAERETAPQIPSSRSPAQIFSEVSPSIAFIETPLSTGSAILIDERHVVTNAHVVWPFDRVRVVFPNGDEVPAAPVVGIDLMADLAVVDVGPRTGQQPVASGTIDEIRVGSEVLLIGYPGEAETSPQPTLATGVVSRLRTWDALQMSFIQTDASIAGGQSGGALVSASGNVIGISTFSFAEGNFALAISMQDVIARIQALIDGEDIAGLGDRSFPKNGGRFDFEFQLDNVFHQRTFVAWGTPGTVIDLEVDSENDAWVAVDLSDGLNVTFGDQTTSGLETVSFVVESEEPYLITVGQSTVAAGQFSLRSSLALSELRDSDDGRVLIPGVAMKGNLDHPLDADYFSIDLQPGDTLIVTVDTVNFDPEVAVDIATNVGDVLAVDDDSGGGVFGLNAQVSYTTVVPGTYLIAIDDVEAAGHGGYFVTVEVEPELAGLSTTPGVRTSVFDLRDGDCFNTLDGRPMEAGTWLNVNVVPCSSEWLGQAVSSFNVSVFGLYPGGAYFTEQFANRCDPIATFYLFPVTQGWALGDRLVTCIRVPNPPIDPAIGDCVSTLEIESVSSEDVVSCSDPHFAEVFEVFEVDRNVYPVDGAEYPGDDVIGNIADQGCLAAFQDYVGVEYAQSSFFVIFVFPTWETWEAFGDRVIICFLGAENLDEPIVGTARGSRR